MGPWKLLKIILYGMLTWFLLALAWAFFPSPNPENNGDNGMDYATSVLRAGKTLTRVYDSRILLTSYDRQGFALDYKLDVDALTLSIGSEHVPIISNPGSPEWVGQNTSEIEVQARIGDTDGANLPWFPFADAVLLFWLIDKEHMSIPVSVLWRAQEDGVRTLELRAAANPLLAVEILGLDKSTITVTVPAVPVSSSPSVTYPIRVVILHVIAPTAVIVVFLLGNVFGWLIEFLIDTLFVVLAVGMYGFMALAVVFSLWRCVGGPSFEDTVERIQGRLGRLSEDERLEFLRLGVMQEKLDVLCQNERFKGVLYICRNGWHPERDSQRAAEEEAADVEKGSKIEEGEDEEKGEDTTSRQ